MYLRDITVFPEASGIIYSVYWLSFDWFSYSLNFSVFEKKQKTLKIQKKALKLVFSSSFQQPL